MKKSRGFADQSIGRTYHRFRMLAGGALIGMPLLKACSGFFFVRELEPSLSDYYFAVRDGGLPRTLFLMFLAFLGGKRRGRPLLGEISSNGYVTSKQPLHYLMIGGLFWMVRFPV